VAILVFLYLAALKLGDHSRDNLRLIGILGKTTLCKQK
jgi:hypothetical protein